MPLSVLPAFGLVAGNMEVVGGMAALRVGRAVMGWAKLLPSLPQGTAISKLLLLLACEYKPLEALEDMAWH
jgi:hypothetical protein